MMSAEYLPTVGTELTFKLYMFQCFILGPDWRQSVD